MGPVEVWEGHKGPYPWEVVQVELKVVGEVKKEVDRVEKWWVTKLVDLLGSELVEGSQVEHCEVIGCSLVEWWEGFVGKKGRNGMKTLVEWGQREEELGSMARLSLGYLAEEKKRQQWVGRGGAVGTIAENINLVNSRFPGKTCEAKTALATQDTLRRHLWKRSGKVCSICTTNIPYMLALILRNIATVKHIN